MASQALVPSLIGKAETNAFWQSTRREALILMTSVTFIALLAQVSVLLPFTPVPITGQTFAVLLVSLSLGARRGTAAVATYLLVGAVGAPVFALAQAGLVFGPTLGYLVGMLVSSFVVGSLADRGFTRSIPKAYLACFAASVITFGCGLAVLSQFVPGDQLLVAGLFPFIPGDLIKMSLAIALVRPAHSLLKG